MVGVGNLHDQIVVPRTDVQRSGENGPRLRQQQARQFQHLRVADPVADDGLGTVSVHSLVVRPLAGQRAVAAAIATDQPEILEAAIVRPAPAGAGRIGDVHRADRPRMHPVPAVEVDAVEVDEPLAAPHRRHPHRVVIEDHPVAALGHATGTGIQPQGVALVSKIRRVAADFQGQHQVGTVVHLLPRLVFRRRRTPRVALGQTIQVRLIEGNVLRRIVPLQIRLADVMDHVVFLSGDHPGLRGHHAEPVRQGAIHGIRVAAVFELAGGKLQRRR